MVKFLPLTLAVSLVSSVSSYAWAGWAHRYENFRSGHLYTTYDDKSALATPGEDIFISPIDSFDFVPTVGYGQVESTIASRAEFVDHGLQDFQTSEILVDTNEHEVAEWAKTALNEANIIKSQVPRPNESLVGKSLTVEKAEDILPARESVLCHQIEQKSYICHKTHHVGITAVQVSPNGKPSTLHLACHYGEDSKCHVLNVGDLFFSSAEKKQYLRQAEANWTMNTIRSTRWNKDLKRCDLNQ